MDSKGLVIACLIGFFVGFIIEEVRQNAHKTEQPETKKEVNFTDIKKITKTKSYHITKQINDSTYVIIDSTVWYEDKNDD
jgi:uncharacterized membrane protein YraQ (UPF0718 family)